MAGALRSHSAFADVSLRRGFQDSVPLRTASPRLGADARTLRMRAHADGEDAVDGRAFRRALNKSENYNRSGFGHKKEMLARMEEEYTSKRTHQSHQRFFEAPQESLSGIMRKCQRRWGRTSSQTRELFNVTFVVLYGVTSISSW